ncbi:cyclic nucleotide-gated ion channel 2 isoform X2 [Vitis vinifera]|uniref:cyclic nucleotide-gated ion channel 2 isoform X2 n=1 Tax=Vitis vinifera TaxID=29760 RepID=UPI00053F9600|nr:cyclic nucleotide-gated ion channel 2 isoform X2 [Vitis vinifera]|eukprot:XP_010661110.1 PREDICTED: cyclic nucleotide-gated ion channel 2 isoform X2 [Vitis vinifera]
MDAPPNFQISLPRWIGIFRRRKANSDENYEEDDGPISNSIECYACTQVGVPVFHSTSCDQAHQPEWEASAGSSLIPIQDRRTGKARSNGRPSGPFGPVLDPRTKPVQRWNRAFLLVRGMSLAVDPLFFYVISIGGEGGPCLYMDGGLAAIVTVLRTCVDAVHLFHLWLQFRLAYVSRESLVVGCGKLVWDARAIASHYVRSLKGFWFDLFVILPVPQVVFWLVVPKLIKQEEIKLMMTILLLMFLFQFLPKVYHSVCLMRRMQKVMGYIFGTIWWRFVLNLIAYLIASHVAGGCWYVLAIQRVASCLRQQCDRNSTFANELAPTSNWLEVIFSICIVLSGLLLFTLLIGNIQVFLQSVMAKKRKMQLRYREIEWWMRRRQLPSHLRQRVRRFERHSWAAMGGEDEMELIQDLPEGLRRDIKRHLCLDLIKKVPLFQSLDDLILDNICDRVKPLVFCKDEKIIREGDPVHRMVFITRGHIKSSQNLSKGMVATSLLEPGDFLGDELLSWCIRRPFIDRHPASSATFVCVESTEAFGLDANHLRFITEHFRYKFANERLKRTARYYSSNWRTWAAVNIQLAWRRYIIRTRGAPAIPVIENGGSDRRLRQCAAMFMSLRPHDHLE